MTRRQELYLMTATIILAASPLAFADSNSNNGNANIINDNSGIGSGNVTTNSNNPNVSATGGSANTHNSNRQSQKQKQSQSQSQQSKSSVRSSGNSSNSYVAQAQARNPASTAFAAPLVASEDTCMGSSSAGGQGVGFGLSLGTTWHDKDCVRRKDARELYNMGQRKASLALLCQSDSVAAAMRTAGTPCPGREDDSVPDDQEHHEKHSADNAAEGVIYEYPTSGRRWER
jgi:hypothetical protein